MTDFGLHDVKIVSARWAREYGRPSVVVEEVPCMNCGATIEMQQEVESIGLRTVSAYCPKCKYLNIAGRHYMGGRLQAIAVGWPKEEE